MEKYEELNKEFYKYNKAIVKLLDDSLKQGEYFLFTKLNEGGYGIVISRERIEGISPNKSHRILDILEDECKTDGVIYKMNIPENV